MRHAEFDKLLKEILERTTTVLSTKSDEYSTDSDKLHNFKRAGAMLNCTPEKALIGMWTKHIISILDIVDTIDKESSEHNHMFVTKPYSVTVKKVEEKIGDAINYLILLEALIKERYEE
jgi:hypothetical protein